MALQIVTDRHGLSLIVTDFHSQISPGKKTQEKDRTKDSEMYGLCLGVELLRITSLLVFFFPAQS